MRARLVGIPKGENMDEENKDTDDFFDEPKEEKEGLKGQGSVTSQSWEDEQVTYYM